MKIAALADTHIGFRQFPATTEGRNAREVDVELAWARAVQGVIDEQPDLVTIAGDVFHHPRVSAHAVRAFLAGVQRLVQETGAHIIVLLGNHDAGKTAELLTPIALAALFGEHVHVVTTPKRVVLAAYQRATALGGGRAVTTWPHPAAADPDVAQFIDREDYEIVAVTCLPFTMGEQVTYKLEPDADADVNVLLVHAAVKDGKLPHFYGHEGSLDVAALAERYDVVAVGDYHELTPLHPTRMAFYSGSLERTSSDIWKEKAPKGFVVCDTETGKMRFVEVPTRPMYDYAFATFTVEPMKVSGHHVNLVLDALLGREEHRDAIVRLKIDDFPREQRDQIDWKLVRRLQAICLHFYLDIRYAARPDGEVGERPASGLTLAYDAGAFFADDLPEVRELALLHLGLAGEKEGAV